MLRPARLQLLSGGLAGSLGWAVSGWRHLRLAGGVLWVGLVEAGRGLAAGATAVKGAVSAGRAVQRSAPEVASQVGGAACRWNRLPALLKLVTRLL